MSLHLNITSRRPGRPPTSDMVWIPGGTFAMGSNDHYPEEAPVHDVTVDGFWMDKYTVTNTQFRRFVEATGYVTVAEREPNAADYPGAKPELLVPASVVFRKATRPVDLRNHYNWWTYVPGANWRQPEGPGSSLKDRARHPVVHVAYDDALAYAAWAGKELPTEAEWEFAARGALEGATYAWGDEFAPRGRQMANTWQGAFPWENLVSDGYSGTSPVGCYRPNGYGLVDMTGNVWEWTSDGFTPERRAPAPKPCCTPAAESDSTPRKVIKGGSHLCAPSYCLRYRPAARQPQDIDTGMSHLGFRCVVRP